MTLADIELERELSRELARVGCGIVVAAISKEIDPARPGEPVWRCGSEIQDVIRSVAKKHGVTPISIMGRCRIRKFIDARHEAVREVVKYVNWEPRFGNCSSQYWSLPKVGKIFGLDHTSILHILGRTKRERNRIKPRQTVRTEEEKKAYWREKKRAWILANPDKVRESKRKSREKKRLDRALVKAKQDGVGL